METMEVDSIVPSWPGETFPSLSLTAASSVKASLPIRVYEKEAACLERTKVGLPSACSTAYERQDQPGVRKMRQDHRTGKQLSVSLSPAISVKIQLQASLGRWAPQPRATFSAARNQGGSRHGIFRALQAEWQRQRQRYLFLRACC